MWLSFLSVLRQIIKLIIEQIYRKQIYCYKYTSENNLWDNKYKI